MADATEYRQHLLEEAAVLEEQLGYSHYPAVAAAEAVDLCRRDGLVYEEIGLVKERWILAATKDGARRLYDLPFANEELHAALQAGTLDDDALEMVESGRIPAPTAVPTFAENEGPARILTAGCGGCAAFAIAMGLGARWWQAWLIAIATTTTLMVTLPGPATRAAWAEAKRHTAEAWREGRRG